MTNFDPGGFLLLLTLLPALAAGALSIGVAHLAARLGVGAYETNVVAVLGVLIVGWIGAAFVVSTGMLYILAVTLSMVGAYAATRNVTSSSYGWVLGVVLLFTAFVALSALGVYQGVDRAGRPRGVIARNLEAFYLAGLLAFGAVAGKAVDVVRQRYQGAGRGAPES